MGLFSRQTSAALLLNRLEALEHDVESLKRGRKALDLEFTELYDKVSHQMSRMAKRHATAAKNNVELPEEEQEELPFPNLDPISRSIMMRRARRGGSQ